MFAEGRALRKRLRLHTVRRTSCMQQRETILLLIPTLVDKHCIPTELRTIDAGSTARTAPIQKRGIPRPRRAARVSFARTDLSNSDPHSLGSTGLPRMVRAMSVSKY